MDAQTYPLQDILKPERRYIIPTFQRDYEWTKEGQWQLLFEDLVSVTERLVARRQYAALMGIALATEEKSVPPHFLGAVVCDSLPFSTGGIALRSVIDGQQRLTTIQLLVRGILDVLIERNSGRVESTRRMLRNPDDVVKSPEETHKLWPRRRDREVWPIAMGDSSPRYEPGDHLYLQAREFFAASTREATVDLQGKPSEERLNALVDALMGLFKLVVIDLDENDDAQVIFEVLNGRQTPLSATDLVKNLLFMRGELSNEDVEKLYDKYWAGFDDDWWKKNVGTGHAQRGRRDVLLSVWLTAVTGEESSVGHLYREVRAYIDLERPTTESVLQDLHAYADAYQAIYGRLPVESPLMRTAYDRLDRLGILTAVPLLAWLRTLPDAQLSDDDHLRAVRAVESWAVRRMMMGWQTRGYGTLLVRVLKDAQSVAKTNGDIADAVITSLGDGALNWPTDDDLATSFVNQRYYGWIGQARLRLILGAIDSQMRRENPMAEPASFDYDALQIEHVMPQSWEEHWPVPVVGQETKLADDDPAMLAAANARTQTVDRIGNLTLVTSTFNQSVSNLSWETKQPELLAQSSLQLNKPIASSTGWSEATIGKRAEELAALASRVWPSSSALTKHAGEVG